MIETVNADPAELAKFSELAHRWWDMDSEFRPLHMINPLRLDWIHSICPLTGFPAALLPSHTNVGIRFPSQVAYANSIKTACTDRTNIGHASLISSLFCCKNCQYG